MSLENRLEYFDLHPEILELLPSIIDFNEIDFDFTQGQETPEKTLGFLYSALRHLPSEELLLFFRDKILNFIESMPVNARTINYAKYNYIFELNSILIDKELSYDIIIDYGLKEFYDNYILTTVKFYFEVSDKRYEEYLLDLKRCLVKKYTDYDFNIHKRQVPNHFFNTMKEALKTKNCQGSNLTFNIREIDSYYRKRGETETHYNNRTSEVRNLENYYELFQTFEKNREEYPKSIHVFSKPCDGSYGFVKRNLSGMLGECGTLEIFLEKHKEFIIDTKVLAIIFTKPELKYLLEIPSRLKSISEDCQIAFPYDEVIDLFRNEENLDELVKLFGENKIKQNK